MNTTAKLGIVVALMALSVMAVSQPASAFIIMSTGSCSLSDSVGNQFDCNGSTVVGEAATSVRALCYTLFGHDQNCG